jgi:hypothetical protein
MVGLFLLEHAPDEIGDVLTPSRGIDCREASRLAARVSTALAGRAANRSLSADRSTARSVKHPGGRTLILAPSS